MPRVYVGNLAASVTSSDLLTHFSRAGEIVRRWPFNRESESAAVSASWRWRNAPTLRSRSAC